MDAAPHARALEAGHRTLTRGAVRAHVGGVLQPTRRLLVEILVFGERAAVEEALSQVADRPLQLVEQQLPRYTAEARECGSQALGQHRNGLPRIEAQPQHPRMGEQHQQRVATVAWQRERAEVHLVPAARPGCEAYRRLGRIARPTWT
ncbi:MAG: hypothetical protein OXH68_21085 [Gammaproteobacteria bacterium]|nr:hypothetical protein [Gammaproteobacteria bacterium]